MKFIINLLLIILFVPAFLILVTTSTLKFQLLNFDFWQTTLRSNNVYTSLSDIVKNQAEDQVLKGGGRRADAEILTDLITPDNLRDFVEKNLSNILNYVNGKVTDLIVYIPVKKIPKGLLPKNLSTISEAMPIQTLLTEFNIKGAPESQIKAVGQVGLWLTYIFWIDLALVVIILTGLIILVEKGKKLVAPGLAFVFSGIISLTLTLLGTVIKSNILNSWVKSTQLTQMLLASFIPYILDSMLKIWTIVGAVSLALGIILFFVTKPGRPESV